MKMVFASVLIAAAAMLPLTAQTAEEETQRLAAAATVLEEIMSAPDKAVPGPVIERAAGIAVFPSLMKGGVIVGGQRGHGVLSVRKADGSWSNPAFLTITGGSVG